MPIAAGSHRSLVAAALLAALTFLAYLPALDAGFIWDDDNYVTANPNLGDGDGLRRIWLEPRASPQFYPLTFTTFWVEHRLWGLDPFGYHLTNIALHAVAAVLFWRILLTLGVPGAWLAAAVFALHPVHVESVAWVTERKNVLSGALYLAAALAFLRFAPPQPDRQSEPRSRLWYALALIAFCGALASKTVASTLPAALLLVLVWQRGRVAGRDLLALAPMFALGIAAGLVTVALERDHVGASGADWAFSAVEHVLIAGRILCFYIGSLLWPAPLLFIYPRWQVDASAAWQYLPPGAVVAAALALFAARRRLGGGPLVALLFYAGTLVPALGFFNVYPMRYSFVADHFAYLATLGPIALGSAAFVRAAAALRLSATAAGAAAAALLAVLALLTWRQAEIYRDAETLWRHTVAGNPDGWLGRIQLAGILADAGRLDEAVLHARAAVAANPGVPEPHNALGSLLELAGRTADAEAQFTASLAIEPRNYEVLTNLAIVLADSGRPREALDRLAGALRFRPDYAEAHFQAGLILEGIGARDAAVQALANTLLLAPGNAPAHAALCRVRVAAGRPADAEAHCREALRLDPDLVEADLAMARLFEAEAQPDAARVHAERAAARIHARVASHRSQAATLAERGEPLAAAAHLRELLRLDPQDSAARAEFERLQGAQPTGPHPP